MRRFAAKLALTALLLWAVAPVLFALQPQDAHACCRRGGAHHCTTPSSDQAGFRGQAEKCPFSCPTAARQSTSIAKGSTPVAVAALSPSHRLTISLSDSAPDAYDGLALDSRGPPSDQLI